MAAIFTNFGGLLLKLTLKIMPHFLLKITYKITSWSLVHLVWNICIQYSCVLHQSVQTLN